MPPSMRVIQVRAQNKAERLSRVDRDLSTGVTDPYPSRGYTHPVTRTVEVSHAACKVEV